jgi:thiol:disulfide interchange protein DsbD
LILVGTFTAILASIPKADVWTLKVKKVFGLLLIVVGEYFLIKAGMMWV